MRKIPDWYVITGGPNSGKTTIINRLSELGYYTVPEVARLFIDKELKEGKTLKQIRSAKIKFQNKITKLKIMLDKKVPKDAVVFFDRGLPDILAYCKFLNVVPSKLLINLPENRYKKIFLLDLLSYKKDYARNESLKEAKRIYKLVKETYKQLGYDVIKVPVMSVGDRVKLILKNIK